MKTQKQLTNQGGYTLIEMMVMGVLLAIVMVVVASVLINVIRQRTRSNYNSETRTSADEVMTILKKNIKDSDTLSFNQTLPATGANATGKCWSDIPNAGNLCITGTPYCAFKQIRLSVDDLLDRVYYLDDINARIIVTNIYKDNHQENSFAISPPTLKVKDLLFTLSPRLCCSEVDGQTSCSSYEQPNDNITIKTIFSVYSPLAETSNAQAFTQSLITLQSTSSLRAYNRFKIAN
ncbi:MAG: hypothetical protein WCP97_05860 [bacterium]